MPISVIYRIVDTTVTESGSWTLSTSATYGASLLVFEIDSPGGPTIKSVTDAGSGSDAVSITASASVADSGAGADAPSVAADVPITDAGAGADVVDVPIKAYQKNVTDTGSGADTLSLAVSLSVADTGSGADGVTVDKPAATWTFEGNRGTAADKSAGTSIGVSPSQTIAVDQVVIVTFASDNLGTTAGATTLARLLTASPMYTHSSGNTPNRAGLWRWRDSCALLLEINDRYRNGRYRHRHPSERYQQIRWP